MAIIEENNNEITQQIIALSNTTYVLDGGSISVNNASAALLVNTGLTNVVVVLRNSLIENPLDPAGEGIQTNSFLRVELGDQASIRTGAVAIESINPAAGLDIFNRGLITASFATAIFASTTTASTVVNFGHIAGFQAVTLNGSGNHTIENSGFIEAGSTSSVAIGFGTGSDTLINSGYVGGGTTFGTGGDTLINSGEVRATVAIADSGGTNVFTNTGSIVTDSLNNNAFNLTTSNDRIDNSGDIFGQIQLESGTDSVFNAGTLRGTVAIVGSAGVKTIVNAGTIIGNITLSTGGDVVTNTGTIIGTTRLGAGIDRFEGQFGASLSVNGEGGDDQLFGSAFADDLDGGDDDDFLTGLGGNDFLGGGLGADTLMGGDGDDLILGDDGNDTVLGGAGGDLVDAGNGSDTASYELARGGVRMSLADAALNTGEAAGDLMFNVENIFGSLYADTLIGDGGVNVIGGFDGNDTLQGAGGNDTLNGDDGNDTLDGGTGNDAMTGALGNDTYLVDSAGDIIVETGAGQADTLLTTTNYTLAAGVLIETLRVSGAVGRALTGNAIAQSLFGGTGSDVLNGGLGADALNGGLGNDTYVLGNATDTVADTGGTDTITTTVNRSLAAFGTIENLILLGGTAGTGNTLANTIIGNGSANTLQGLAGNDELNGGLANDSLFGGTGRDSLTGGANADRFVFDTKLNKVSNVDIVADFSKSQGDRIVLDRSIFTKLGSDVTSASFFKGVAAHDASDRVLYNAANGRLSYDRDGDGAAAAIHFATIGKNLAITHTSFDVIA